MILTVQLRNKSYPVIVERGALGTIGARIDLNRRVLIVTDDGVPPAYAEAVAAAAKEPHRITVPAGEASKSVSTWERLLQSMLEAGLDRRDCVVSVGGGVVSDLAGFAAASYMRGIDFYAVPTTVLAAVDASVGGKTGLNLGGIKNIAGAFHQPCGVVIDPDTFATLSKRQVASGLCEAVKMAASLDAELFVQMESNDPFADLEAIVCRAVDAKRRVVEADETEQDARRVLNFGHTIGHGIESAAGGALLHGECVAMGMLPMCSDAVQKRLRPVLEKLGVPLCVELDPEAVYAALLHDKKANKDGIAVVRVEALGAYRIETVSPARLRPLIEEVVRRKNA